MDFTTTAKLNKVLDVTSPTEIVKISERASAAYENACKSYGVCFVHAWQNLQGTIQSNEIATSGGYSSSAGLPWTSLLPKSKSNRRTFKPFQGVLNPKTHIICGYVLWNYSDGAQGYMFHTCLKLLWWPSTLFSTKRDAPSVTTEWEDSHLQEILRFRGHKINELCTFFGNSSLPSQIKQITRMSDARTISLLDKKKVWQTKLWTSLYKKFGPIPSMTPVWKHEANKIFCLRYCDVDLGLRMLQIDTGCCTHNLERSRDSMKA